MQKQTMLLLLFMFNSVVFATEEQERSLVDIKVGIELTKIEQSIANIDQSIQMASQALQEMAKHPNISPEQQIKITQTFEQLNQLAVTFEAGIKEMPTVIRQSTPPISAAIDNLFSNVQLAILIVLIAIISIVICVLLAIYYWILKPTSIMLLKTTAKVDNMATALQSTAKIVEKNTEQQLLILNAIPVQPRDKDKA